MYENLRHPFRYIRSREGQRSDGYHAESFRCSSFTIGIKNRSPTRYLLYRIWSTVLAEFKMINTCWVLSLNVYNFFAFAFDLQSKVEKSYSMTIALQVNRVAASAPSSEDPVVETVTVSRSV